ncbi:spbB protein [Bacillus thuringiensis]|uniref:SpbB protein n=1 Tax=Bacillus thuringiensis TaxID=1428 RepID=A0A9X6Z3N6_BACTU|nr:spbB protein [Bacillus thuringiensis]MCU5281486.1 spbB protein [Bacillus cereus]MEC3271475.1 spbB protein [Bacillus thuringiensis]PFB02259.1 spbB protein [Bacillus thuringiensis]
MLGILFTAVPSTDVVKDLQDKVISLHEHEVSFLNDTIANMLTVVGIAAAIITAIFSGAFIYVTNSNKRAQEKMGEASAKLEEAESKVFELEEKNTRLEEKIEEANQILAEANSVALIAQEKLDEVEKEQRKLNTTIDTLKTVTKNEATLDHHKIILDNIQQQILGLQNTEYPFFKEERNTLLSNCYKLEQEHMFIKSLINMESISGDSNLVVVKNVVSNFSKDVTDLIKKFQSLKEKMKETNQSNSERE